MRKKWAAYGEQNQLNQRVLRRRKKAAAETTGIREEKSHSQVRQDGRRVGEEVGKRKRKARRRSVSLGSRSATSREAQRTRHSAE